ncbi:MAG: dihydropteroate synthase [Chitinophagales bacterium]
MILYKTLLNCRGRLLDLSTPQVMGIINVTPDSFYDGGKLKTDAELLAAAGKMLEEGAAILDTGGMSSRPGSQEISESTELMRVIPAIESIHKNFPESIISVDTWRGKVAEEAVQAGASMVNDISGGRFDKNLLSVISKLKVPYVLMHMQGTPLTMQFNPVYNESGLDDGGVVKEVFDFLKEKILKLNELGMYDIIVDPGFGFGKTVEHNFGLLNHLDVFKIFGLPMLAGLSRKSMICNVLKVNPHNALNGTTAINAIALMKGAKLLRVHDVKEARETIQLIEKMKDY